MKKDITLAVIFILMCISLCFYFGYKLHQEAENRKIHDSIDVVKSDKNMTYIIAKNDTVTINVYGNFPKFKYISLNIPQITLHMHYKLKEYHQTRYTNGKYSFKTGDIVSGKDVDGSDRHNVEFIGLYKCESGQYTKYKNKIVAITQHEGDAYMMDFNTLVISK